MKKAVLVLALLGSMQALRAQTWAEWFRQRKTQIKYLVNQIAALKVYTDYLQKAYRITKEGTVFIKAVKRGDFDLHNGYFTSLKTVSPTIKNSSRVASIISDQVSILKIFQNLSHYIDQSGQLSSEDKAYVHTVYSNLNMETMKDLDELYLLINSGELEMKDNERILKMDRIYHSMEDKLSFSRSFASQLYVLIQQRMQEKSEAERLRKVYGIQ
jgi:hypothetical protein